MCDVVQLVSELVHNVLGSTSWGRIRLPKLKSYTSNRLEDDDMYHTSHIAERMSDSITSKISAGK
jgi:hypothetical protein